MTENAVHLEENLEVLREGLVDRLTEAGTWYSKEMALGKNGSEMQVPLVSHIVGEPFQFYFFEQNETEETIKKCMDKLTQINEIYQKI